MACLALAVGGASWVLALSLFNVTVQLSTPRWVVGRALAAYQTATFGGMALGSWVWGVAAEAYGGGAGAAVCGGASCSSARVIGLEIALPEETTLNLDPLNRWKEPPLALDLKPRSGPIVIMIEYTIREEDTPPFLEAMAERRRVRATQRRRATGRSPATWKIRACGWRFTTFPPGWSIAGTISGRTYADQVVADRIRALHSGSEPPRVHRMIERPTSWSDTLFATRSIFELP